MTNQSSRNYIKDGRWYGWWRDVNEVFEDDLSVYALAVRVYIARCSNEAGQAFPSLQTIADAVNISRRKVSDAIRELMDKGWLLRQARTRPGTKQKTSTLYQLAIPPHIRKLRSERMMELEQNAEKLFKEQIQTNEQLEVGHHMPYQKEQKDNDRVPHALGRVPHALGRAPHAQEEDLYNKTKEQDNNIYVQTEESLPVDNPPLSSSSRAFSPPIVDSGESTSSLSISSLSKNNEPLKTKDKPNQGNGTPVNGESSFADKPKPVAKKNKTFKRMKQLARNEYPAGFEAFWNEYPRKESKADAYKAWQMGKEAFELDDEKMLEAVKAYASEMQRLNTERQYIKLCGGWIREGRVLDYLDPAMQMSESERVWQSYQKIMHGESDYDENRAYREHMIRIGFKEGRMP